MDGKTLFLCDNNRYTARNIGKNIHTFPSLTEANALEDYHIYITNGFEHGIRNTSELLNEIERGAIMIFLIPQNHKSYGLRIEPFGYLNGEPIRKTSFSEIITSKRDVKNYLKMAETPKFVFNATIQEIRGVGFCNIELIRPIARDTHTFEPFMIHKRSKKVFFGSISYGMGKIILLPQLDFYDTERITLLADIALGFLDVEIESFVKKPEWVDDIIIQDEKKLNDEISSLEMGKNKLTEERKKYDELKRLLYTNGKHLEKAVERAFILLGCAVTRTEPGANVDRYIKYKKLKFFAEITGINSKINKDSKKLSQITSEFQNQKTDEVTKPLLIANTYMDKKIEKRGEINFTDDALKVIGGFEPCCMTAYTLYQLVIDFLEGKRTSDKIMNLICETNGVLEIKKK